MIFTDRTIMVQKGTSSINDTIVLYRGDRDIEVRFSLNEGSPFKFGSRSSSNIIEKTEAAYGQLVIKTPNDLPTIFSEVTPTNEGRIVFTITSGMIDEVTEVGNYTFQIRLLDKNMDSRATLPEVVDGIEIREPIALEDISTTNEVEIATVGYALTTAGTQEDIFDTEGNYNKTTWTTGDRITAPKLNKIEEGIDGVNKKIADNSSQIKEKASKTDFIVISSNLFNKDDIITNKYINNTDGTLADSTTNSVSQLIDINPSTQLTFKNIQKIACYDKSKNFLRIKEFPIDSVNTYTLNADVYFIQTQQPKAALDRVQINEGSELLPYESYYKNLKEDIGIKNIENKIKKGSITSDKRSVLGTFGRLYISASANDVACIDTTARTLTLNPNFWILVNKKRYVHNTQVILTFLDTATLQYLFYNTTTSTFKFIKATLENEILEDDVYIGMFTFSSNTESNVTIKHAYCDFPLKIDGEIVGDYSTKISNFEERLKAIENNGGSSIDIPKNIPIYVPKNTYACDGSDSNGFTHDVTKANDVYAKYDELVNKYPNYITKTLLGNDTSDTLPIYKYEFKPTQPSVIEGYDNTLKKIILINGIHGGGRTKDDSGDNPTAVFALYYLMKDICENSGQEGLEYLRRNVHFIIIPIANPWGFDNLSRYNVNSVDINRNFDYKWARVEHTGASAFSEKETQYIRDVINANKDALFASDLHIQGGGTDPNLDTRLLWSSLNTGSKLYYPSNYLISRMSGLWQGKYDLSDIEYYGYLSANNNGMMTRSWIEYVAGIPCNTFEMSSATMNQTRNNANIMFMITQTLGNWILSCLSILS